MLAVKPQQMEAVSRSLQELATTRQPTVLSVAAGTRLAQLQEWLGADVPVVRTMPNRPAFVGAGITGLYASSSVGFEARNHAAALMRAAGDIVWVTEERLLDAVTAVSGSGPAYFFLLIEALAAAGEAVGLPAATARELAVTTAYGAGKMARDNCASKSPPKGALLRPPSPSLKRAASGSWWARPWLPPIYAPRSWPALRLQPPAAHPPEPVAGPYFPRSFPCAN